MNYRAIVRLAKCWIEKLNKLCSFVTFVMRKKKYRKEDAQKNIIVLFDTEDLTINRRLAQVVLQFLENGYDCRLRVSLKDYLATSNGDYSEIVFNATYPIRNSKYDILVCSKNNSDYSCKRIVFNDSINTFPNHINSPFFYPLIFHPLKIVNKAESYISDLYSKNSDNRIGIIFIGNTDITTYQKFENIIHNEYGMSTRLDVLAYIKKNFSEDVFEPQTKEEFYLAYHDVRYPLNNKIVIIDKFRISGNEYFDILYNSMFHLWTCGDAFPYCHNQIEGMACGAIPICESFQKRPLYVGMKHMKNCMVFNSFNELESIISNVLSLKYDGAVDFMRKSIRQLFLNTFSLRAFSNKARSFLENSKNEVTYYIHPTIYK